MHSSSSSPLFLLETHQPRLLCVGLLCCIALVLFVWLFGWFVCLCLFACLLGQQQRCAALEAQVAASNPESLPDDSLVISLQRTVRKLCRSNKLSDLTLRLKSKPVPGHRLVFACRGTWKDGSSTSAGSTRAGSSSDDSGSVTNATDALVPSEIDFTAIRCVLQAKEGRRKEEGRKGKLRD